MLVKNENAVMGVAVKPATKRRTRPAERVRLAEDSRGEQRWKLWGSYLSERQWGRCARTTARTERLGITSLMITRAAGPTAGARTAWPALATTPSGYAWRLRSGTVRTRSSRSGCLA